MTQIKGIGVSNGIAIASAYRLVEPDLSFEKVEVADHVAEKNRFNEAILLAKGELELIRERAIEKFGEDKAAIFSAHLLVLQDPELKTAIEAKIDEGINAEAALEEVSTMFVTMFESMENEYMRERAADIRDVSHRLLSKLLNRDLPDLTTINEDVIIIAEDLTPSMTAQLNKEFVKGFVTNIGGRTSHSAILARTLEIPAVVGTKNATESGTTNEMIILDGSKGIVIFSPSTTEIEQYEREKKEFEAEQQALKAYVDEVSQDADGHHVELAGNIGRPDDLEIVLANGGDGVGLFRTEFLYMDRSDFPTEEEQFQSYKTVLEKMGDKPTVVRTLDIGGDKELPYLKLPHEMNPFLGYRAIRLCLDDRDLFRVQLRALLRASVFGNLKIMFPMIATLDEFREAKNFLLEVKEQLISEGVDVSNSIEIGMMVEIPSAAVIADLFAKEADFMSIGTNDLIQYTFAADRMNEKVSYLYQPYHPAILRLVKNVIDAGHANGKWVGMCGEMAGDPIAIPLLLALGLDEFSMSASSILHARKQISTLSKAQLSSHIDHILTLSTAQEVEAFVKQITQ
ncbi:phosphoenolpyruvate-protein phosphotransferase [Kurthia zopfii]|uniref:Phosphoenolpyruvate-protein phosphotransferase n=1 Tax=Kurthia zopfii TaxID=1650 RepID=A0A8B4QBH9_9BACL|nr:phosphoenolpyruvate--protein phosphotransferase [Kurthia zopfii]PWI24018.1 phosphoenolpyruvate--protein phosphotransferase [Kurthia zopfii]TDR44271.1 phosphoenolpyruvate--protein phosphotransferase [Kurthia zopfii]GEK29773.1 phosphoenolpyruvate-protein phosphotransferase [Kurthia zopfii]STX10123.1 Phosphoenolpyruvate-protein phosphotransferase [Kurthia zopfii]